MIEVFGPGGVVAGGRGNDVIRAAGDVSIYGEAGNDRIDTVGARTEHLGCGSAYDVVLAGQADKVAADCESVTRD